MLLLLTFALTTGGASGTEMRAVDSPSIGLPTMQEHADSGPLRVLTLNVAHGRKDALNQVLVSREAVKRNLTEVAGLLRDAGADVVALQEADGPSRWSGGFDHVSVLAGQATYPWHLRASHAKTWLFEYGTALLSRSPFTDRLDHSFRPSPPSMTKGLTLGQVAWRPDGDARPIYVDIVSVHLDFSRESVRKQQVAEMAKILSDRTHAMIILGDLNSEWSGRDSIVTELAHRCGLQVYQPLADDLGTYRSSGRRLDWVLISDELEFLHHEVLQHAVSDHHAVVADIGLKAVSADAPARARTVPRCAG